MKYFCKILLISSVLMFVFFLNCTVSRANNTVTAGNSASQNQQSGQITTTVKSTSSAENELLSATNIINILLIAVGIVLILLAIAIFTRLKSSL